MAYIFRWISGLPKIAYINHNISVHTAITNMKNPRVYYVPQASKHGYITSNM